MRAHIRVRLEDFGRREGAYFGVVADGVLQGVVSVQDVLRRHERGQLGYWLSAMACGRGIGTEAVGLAVEFGFAELGLHRLEIRCSPRNLGSRRIAEKLGFQQEGLLRDAEVLFGNYEDNIVFSMLEPEWAAMSSDRVR
jgi:ribosomal-protein-serine acetyltransferase